jgi:hypothetical protein
MVAMQRIMSTVIAVVGEHAGALVESLGAAANVRTSRPDPDRAPLERAVAAWSEAVGSRSPYLLHDADPLADVATAWVRRYDEQGPAGELELAIRETVLRWRARAIELPDYYLVLDPGGWPATRRHWYLGFLHRAAPSRVLVAAGEPREAGDRIAHLGSGPWWPDLDDLLAGVDRVVPDRL